MAADAKASAASAKASASAAPTAPEAAAAVSAAPLPTSFTGYLHLAYAVVVCDHPSVAGTTLMSVYFPPEVEATAALVADLVHRTERKTRWKPTHDPSGPGAPSRLIALESGRTRSVLVSLTFPRPACDVVGGLVPAPVRASGFNVYHFFTDFRFMPRWPDYASSTFESLNVKYYTAECKSEVSDRTPHPLVGVQRYVDTKTDRLYGRMVKMVGLEDVFEREGDIYDMNVDRPRLGDEADGEESEDDEGPHLRVSVDGDDAGMRVGLSRLGLW